MKISDRRISDTVGLFGVFLFFALVILGAYGYFENIIKLIDAINDPVTGMMILRGVAIFFFPLGAVLGYF